jgi:stage III sporulation protein AG
MLLILLSELLPQSDAKSDESSAAVSGIVTAEEYQTQLENRLCELIGQMEGAGHVAVMVTLENGEETLYALDTQSGQTQSQQTHVLLEDGSALTQTVYLPQVRGVAVVCDGGGDIHVAVRITEMLSALLDVPTNRICVEKRSE